MMSWLSNASQTELCTTGNARFANSSELSQQPRPKLFFFEKHCGGDPHSIKTLINLGKEKVYLQI
jgi:hypothetical protein